MKEEFKTLADKKFWEKGYTDRKELSAEDVRYPIPGKIYEHFSGHIFKNKNIFEIGCYPGRFLYHFGRLGFNLNGIDQTDFLEKMMIWFRDNNFSIGEFTKGDIFDYNTEKKYDLVFSSGFIEHFPNFVEVIKIHTNFVKNGGYIFITAPNFAGSVQKFLHTILDKENLSVHYLPAMDYNKWEEVLIKENYEIIDGGYIGGFDFWSANKNIVARIFTKLIRIIFCWRFLPNTRLYSPEIFIVAKKK